MLAGPRVSKLVGNSYVNIVRHAPRLFQCLYKLGGLVSSARHHSPVYYANALLAKKLTRYLDTHHYDIIVTPHLFPAQTLTYMKEKNLLSQKIVAIETDYTCIPFWEETVPLRKRRWIISRSSMNWKIMKPLFTIRSSLFRIRHSSKEIWTKRRKSTKERQIIRHRMRLSQKKSRLCFTISPLMGNWWSMLIFRFCFPQKP